MDRKLSINPAVKKHQQFIQPERCFSSSTSADSPSDMMSSSSNDFRPIIPSQYYYNSPYFQFGLPSYPTYYSAESVPSMWSQYYPGCSFVPMFINYNSNSVGMLRNVYLYGNQ